MSDGKIPGVVVDNTIIFLENIDSRDPSGGQHFGSCETRPETVRCRAEWLSAPRLRPHTPAPSASPAAPPAAGRGRPHVVCHGVSGHGFAPKARFPSRICKSDVTNLDRPR
ncbi:hypothetical protein EVAR_6953_1 [Eumeta japonica]|uniref:Uncharacterized protein n=1 Tax=Eumeta variegata TaxID=151549 RepID=A0A4C1THL3_EUMVA|nr:hypothetical protein EVAR_6953_1 [Eumeta japonica]